jgi:hypothetical protein
LLKRLIILKNRGKEMGRAGAEVNPVYRESSLKRVRNCPEILFNSHKPTSVIWISYHIDAEYFSDDKLCIHSSFSCGWILPNFQESFSILILHHSGISSIKKVFLRTGRIWIEKVVG